MNLRLGHTVPHLTQIVREIPEIKEEFDIERRGLILQRERKRDKEREKERKRKRKRENEGERERGE